MEIYGENRNYKKDQDENEIINIHRHWEPTINGFIYSNILKYYSNLYLNKKHINYEIPNSFKILQWNILARGLSARKNDIPPLPNKKFKESSNGNFLTPVELIDDVYCWKKRSRAILDEIDRINPDIFCLEEVDEPNDIYNHFKYNGKEIYFIHQENYDSNCLQFGYYPDGIAIGINKNKFDIIDFKKGTHIDKEKVLYIITIVKFIEKDQLICFIVFHLKENSNVKSENKRCIQYKSIYNEALYLISKYDINMPISINADFNACPVTFQNNTGEIIYPEVITNVLNDNFISSYSIQGDNKWTTCTMCPKGEIKQVIDYQLFTSEFNIIATLSIPPTSELPEYRLPCVEYPSDHISLATIVSLSDNKQGKSLITSFVDIMINNRFIFFGIYCLYFLYIFLYN